MGSSQGAYWVPLDWLGRELRLRLVAYDCLRQGEEEEEEEVAAVGLPLTKEDLTLRPTQSRQGGKYPRRDIQG